MVDDYAWLRDKDDPDTIAYLTAENAYTEAATAHLAGLREAIFGEIRSRTQETDLSVPARKDGYWYYSRTVEGQQYAIHCRVPVTDPAVPPATDGGAPAGEQVLLDENELAGGSEFFALGAFDVTTDGRLLAYSTDFAGDERFTLRVKDLTTGETLPDEVPNTFYGSAWSADGTALFYLTVDEAWRPHRVWRHTVGAPAADDVVVFEEPDERFWVSVALTRSRRYVVIDVHSKVTSEVRLIPAADPTLAPVTVWPRRDGVEYSLDHQVAAAGHPDRFLILHNAGAENFALAAAPEADPADWTTLIEHRPDTRLLDVAAFAEHLVVHYRRDGLTGLRVIPDKGEPREVTFPEPVYTVDPDANPEYDTTSFRLRYVSLATPDSVYDYDVAGGGLTLRKRRPVLGDFDPARYVQYREWATAPDGTQVPISLMARVDTPRDGSAPAVLYGYGSYETSMDPWFSIARLSLVDRGFVFAVAHVRGGGELGRRWYDTGKLLHKKNTFTDFVAAARHLADAGWSSADRIVARGGSAGGLLVGAAVNLAPDAFGAVVAEVPFVDALNTILDPSLPLTVTEWEEWGNPLASAEAYAYIKSYSPYENVTSAEYPPILAMSSLNDTRVLYVEPTKWIARLRAVGKGGPFMLQTEMGAGHGGPSGRYDAWREEAFIAAWIIDTVGDRT